MPERDRSMFLELGASAWTSTDLPVTEVLALLTLDPVPGLWVKCLDHGAHRVDPERLLTESRRAHQARRTHDYTVAIRLDEVIAL